jgi:hypothetical protein
MSTERTMIEPDNQLSEFTAVSLIFELDIRIYMFTQSSELLRSF